jgi:hypothetical protein
VWLGEKEIMLEIFVDKKNKLDCLLLHDGINKVKEITDGAEQIETLKSFYNIIATG